jgi:hypothetical protein
MFLKFCYQCKKIPVSSFKLGYTVGLRAHTVLFYYTPDKHLANAQAVLRNATLTHAHMSLAATKDCVTRHLKKQIGSGNVY